MASSHFTIGLTGGIGSGKSEVSRRFASHGISIVDADEIAREVVLPGQSALREIAARFGPDVITATGVLNRAKLRDIIFFDKEAKAWLESLLHPQINRLIRSRLALAESPYVILVSPLLLEAAQHNLVDRVLVVDASETLQMARANQRDKAGAENIKAIMANQLSREERLARADDVIHNLGDLASLDAQVAALHQQYLTLAQNHQAK